MYRGSPPCTSMGARAAVPLARAVVEGAPNGRQNSSAINIDSDSDSEGFVEVPPICSKSNGKAAPESLKTGGKASSFSKGEAGKGGSAYSASKGGKGSSSNAMPTKSDADLKLELGQLPSVKYPLFLLQLFFFKKGGTPFDFIALTETKQSFMTDITTTSHHNPTIATSCHISKAPSNLSTQF